MQGTQRRHLKHFLFHGMPFAHTTIMVPTLCRICTGTSTTKLRALRIVTRTQVHCRYHRTRSHNGHNETPLRNVPVQTKAKHGTARLTDY